MTTTGRARREAFRRAVVGAIVVWTLPYAGYRAYYAVGEGLLYATLSLTLVRSTLRRPWIGAAIAGCLLLSVVGVLSGLGVIGSVRVG
ncbi:MAG TPA: hypothetical protein VE476_15865 [Propionibacteriaceae bacterium]|jgi:hypothetical protein|nr:hypothetical protein [Propionibacteriaceae bacterium]